MWVRLVPLPDLVQYAGRYLRQPALDEVSLHYKVGRAFPREINMSNNGSENIIGIDISKAKFDLALFKEGKTKNKKCANNQKGFVVFLKWLQHHKVEQAHICMESTNVYGEALAEFLHKQGYRVSVVNPARVKGFAQSELSRTKTDKADAALIARFCEALKPEQWFPDPPEIKQLKALVRRLESLIEMKQQEVNRLDVAQEILTTPLQKHIDYLTQSIKETRKQIDEHIDNHPDLKLKKELLKSIPGVGPATINVVLSEFSNIDSFETPKKLAAFIGVSPREKQSGSSVKGRASMSKIGNSNIRKAFFFPAMVGLKYNPILIKMKVRLEKAGKPKMVIVGAAMRKLIHLIYGVLKNGVPFDPNYSKNSL